MASEPAVQHHPPGELLMEYAAGASEEAHAVFIACHLTYCPRCRAQVAQLEALGMMLMPGGEGEGGDPLAGMPAVLPAQEPHSPTADAQASSALKFDPLIPAPLLPYCGASNDLAWVGVLPGVETVALPLMLGTVPARLIRAAPGRGVPMHTHRGQELDLILQGGLRDLDRGRDFEPGDVQSADSEVSHHLEVLPGEACVLLSVNEAPVKAIGLWSRMIYRRLPW